MVGPDPGHPEIFEGRVITFDYQLEGQLFSLPNLGMAEQLNRSDRPFLPVGSPRLRAPDAPPGAPPLARADFMAVPKERIMWIVGGRPSAFGGRGTGPATVRAIAVLFGSAVIRGELHLAGNLRVSDYIASRTAGLPFDTLRGASLSRLEHGLDLARLPLLERFDHVTVNLRNNTGIAELVQVDRSRG